jgi:hypothetical protein
MSSGTVVEDFGCRNQFLLLSKKEIRSSSDSQEIVIVFSIVCHVQSHFSVTVPHELIKRCLEAMPPKNW